jgi:hypothetical protein
MAARNTRPALAVFTPLYYHVPSAASGPGLLLESLVMPKKGRKRKQRRKAKANHGKRPNAGK